MTQRLYTSAVVHISPAFHPVSKIFFHCKTVLTITNNCSKKSHYNKFLRWPTFQQERPAYLDMNCSLWDAAITLRLGAAGG